MSLEAHISRLDAVEARLAALASTPIDAAALTDADPGSGERWDGGQVWAHLAEFVPYWLEQLRAVTTAFRDEPVPFGRTKTDPARVAAIERDRSLAIAVLWSQTLSDMESLRRFLEVLPEAAWHARGLHPTLGVMDVGGILDEFLVGHLEEHADQLASLTAG